MDDHSAISEKAYLSASTLERSIFDFGDLELLKALENANKEIHPSKMMPKSQSLLENISTGLLFIQASSTRRSGAILKIRNNILKRIESGELFGLGYSLPRNLKDTCRHKSSLFPNDVV